MRSDLEKYQDQWEKALADGVFDGAEDDAPKAPVQNNWFGYSPDLSKTEINDTEADYWKRVLAGEEEIGDEGLLSEESEPTKDELKKMSARAANTHNPVSLQTLGNDQDVVVTQNWGVGGKEIEELTEMKVKLEQLESRLNAEEGMGNKGKGISEQINALKKQIDDLSNSLNGNRLSDSDDRLK